MLPLLGCRGVFRHNPDCCVLLQASQARVAQLEAELADHLSQVGRCAVCKHQFEASAGQLLACCRQQAVEPCDACLQAVLLLLLLLLLVSSRSMLAA